MNSTSEMDASGHTLAKWAIGLTAASPVIFGLTTWDHSASRVGLQATLLGNAIPIVLIELIAAVLILLSGTRLADLGALVPMKYRYALIALGCIVAATALFVALEQYVSIVRSYTWAAHLLFGLSIASLVRRGLISQREVWVAVLIGLIGYLVLIAAFVATIDDPKKFDWLQFKLGITNVRHLGYYATIGFCLSLAITALAATRRSYVLSVAAATLFVGLACWSGTRGALFAFAGAIGAGVVFVPKFRRLPLFGAILLSLTCGAALSTLHVPPDPHYGLARIFWDSQRPGADNMSSGRVVIWKGTWREIKKRPVFGYGEGQFRYVVPESLGYLNQPHNSILQVLLAWGFVGGGIAIALAGSLWYKLLIRVRRGSEPAFISFCVINGLIALSMIDSALFYPYPVMMAAFALAMGLPQERRTC